MEDEFRLHHAPTGSWRYVSVRAVPVLNADGSVRERVGMASDITERKEAEDRLRKARLIAEQASEAKNQFLAIMSHELRTPLTAVIGLSDLMGSEVVGPMNDVQKRHLARIKTSAWHLVAIIDEVLTYSRTEAGRTEVTRALIDVAEIAREVVGMVEFTAREKKLALALEGAGQPAHLFSDGGKIRQIVTNLVGNAVKFTDTGQVTVFVNAAAPDRVELQVRDTGPGIPENQVEEVFQPFVQADSSLTRKKGGSGLGLAVCRRLARLLGGDVTLETAPGQGCTFTLSLPRRPEARAT
jgi:signal transduction histidine kinase